MTFLNRDVLDLMLLWDYKMWRTVACVNTYYRDWFRRNVDLYIEILIREMIANSDLDLTPVDLDVGYMETQIWMDGHNFLHSQFSEDRIDDYVKRIYAITIIVFKLRRNIDSVLWWPLFKKITSMSQQFALILPTVKRAAKHLGYGGINRFGTTDFYPHGKYSHHYFHVVRNVARGLGLHKNILIEDISVVKYEITSLEYHLKIPAIHGYQSLHYIPRKEACRSLENAKKRLRETRRELREMKW